MLPVLIIATNIVFRTIKVTGEWMVIFSSCYLQLSTINSCHRKNPRSKQLFKRFRSNKYLSTNKLLEKRDINSELLTLLPHQCQ